MRIYFVTKEKSKIKGNYFIPSLGTALERLGCKVSYGLNLLWSKEVFQQDIVHFQWPEGIFGITHDVSDEEIKQMEIRLSSLRNNNIVIYFTCHNLKPHNNTSTNLLKLYDIIYKSADVVIHLGEYSRIILSAKYPNAHHLIIPHHIYDNYFQFNYSKSEAIKNLSLPINKKIVLSFGKFRNDNERDFILKLNKETDDSILFLMPGFYREPLLTKNPRNTLVHLCKYFNYKVKGIRFKRGLVPDDELEWYFCAADAILIQRLDILNSGNLPMAYAAGKVVIGPNIGNVGCILKQTNNFVYNPGDIPSAKKALFRALESNVGELNRKYAFNNWSTDNIASILLYNYNKSINQKL